MAAEVSIDVDASISHKIDTGDDGGDKSNPEDSGALGRGNTQQEAAAAVGLPPPPDFTPVELRWDGLCVSFTNSKGQTTTVLQGEHLHFLLRTLLSGERWCEAGGVCCWSAKLGACPVRGGLNSQLPATHQAPAAAFRHGDAMALKYFYTKLLL